MIPQCEDAIEAVRVFLKEMYKVTPILYRGLTYADYCTVSAPWNDAKVNIRRVGATRLSVGFPTARYIRRKHMFVDLHDPDSLDRILEFCEYHLGKKRR
jgi:hypothetical protein